MIRGNRANCAMFAQSYRLDWLVNRLESQQSSKGVLEVLHCVLIDSPEALNMIKEKHIITIISLIDKHGRDPKVSPLLVVSAIFSSSEKYLHFLIHVKPLLGGHTV